MKTVRSATSTLRLTSRNGFAPCFPREGTARSAISFRGSQIIDSLSTPQPLTASLMPKLYDLMVRMSDEDVRREYLKQVEIIMKDDPNVSDRVKASLQTIRTTAERSSP